MSARCCLESLLRRGAAGGAWGAGSLIARVAEQAASCSSGGSGGSSGGGVFAASARAASGAAASCSSSSSGCTAAAPSGARSLHSLCAPGAFSADPTPPLRLPRRIAEAEDDVVGGGGGGGDRGVSGESSSGGGGGFHYGNADPLAPQPPPALCGHPKNKISRHRAGNRRRRYYVEPWGALAACPHCDAVGQPHQQLYTSERCKGRCLDGLVQREYPKEYKPPC